MQTSMVGRPVSDLDTPALLVDLDILEANIAAMAGDLKARGCGWRPHSKANKSPWVASRELAAGALGITCAKLGEAEVMVAGGVRDILISNQVVGPIKTRRLAAINADTTVSVKCCVDSIENVREIGQAASALGTTVTVLIEVNCGMERAGVAPEAALALAQAIVEVPGVAFGGLMTWEGHAMSVADPAERERVIQASVQKVLDAADQIRAAGIPVGIVSTGGTGTYLISGAMQGVTEVQAGGGIFGDAIYVELGANVKPALTLLAQVTSRPTPTRVIVDCGRKTVDPSVRAPKPHGLEIVGNVALSAEHGTLNLATASSTPKVGDRVAFGIGYSDQILHLHEVMWGVRDGIVVQAIPVAGRGRLQ